jgi:phage portal protein BeeE
MPNIFSRIFSNKQNQDINKYVDAFIKHIGGSYTQYDRNAETYINKGFLYNPDVYSIIQAQSTKAASIPWKVKVNDIKKEFPLERPNILQTWEEVKSLQKMFLKTTGNIFLYVPKPEEGANKGVPNSLWVLPSHLIKIVLKDNVDITLGGENPIKSYMLIKGRTFVEFNQENVIHIKYSNPDFDFNGAHLYGLSPLRPLLRNIQSSNEAIDNNNRTLLNSGAFGFITGKNVPLNPQQAQEVKDRLTEMRAGTKPLSHIQGASAELQFTNVGLNTKDLQPFEFLKFDQKALCNALQWSDKLLNNDDGAKYDNVNNFRKQVITDNIMPDNRLIDNAYQNGFVRLFKGYENADLMSIYDNLPEMQEDLNTLMVRVEKAINIGLISRSQGLELLGWSEYDDGSLNERTVNQDVIPLSEAIATDFTANDNRPI